MTAKELLRRYTDAVLSVQALAAYASYARCPKYDALVEEKKQLENKIVALLTKGLMSSRIEGETKQEKA